MDLRQLRYFAAIVEYGSVSRAAHQLGVAQPALSQHLRHMEAELGVPLLHRGSKGIIPTSAGARLLKHAKTIIAEFETMRDTVRSEENAPSGGVQFGLSGSVSELLGVPLIKGVRARYPSVRIRVREAMSGFLIDWLRRGDIDLAVAYGLTDPRDLSVHHVLTEELCLFAAPGARDLPPPGGDVSLARAASLNLILPGPAQGLRVVIEEAAITAAVALNPDIEVDSYAQLKLLTLSGLGFGILPYSVVRREAASGVFETWRLVDPPMTRQVYLAYSNERPLSSAARAVGQLSWEVMRELVRDGLWTATLSDEDDAPRMRPSGDLT